MEMIDDWGYYERYGNQAGQVQTQAQPIHNDTKQLNKPSEEAAA